jgi:hypothetical protein
LYWETQPGETNRGGTNRGHTMYWELRGADLVGVKFGAIRPNFREKPALLRSKLGIFSKFQLQ